jgi:hypothetical protein
VAYADSQDALCAVESRETELSEQLQVAQLSLTDAQDELAAVQHARATETSELNVLLAAARADVR